VLVVGPQLSKLPVQLLDLDESLLRLLEKGLEVFEWDIVLLFDHYEFSLSKLVLLLPLLINLFELGH